MGGGSFTLVDSLSDRREAIHRGVLTPEACVIKCGQDGYAFADPQNGEECWCDDVSESESVVPCTRFRYKEHGSSCLLDPQ